ncbi:MAG TPA: PAS domain S-box protein [Gemmatimonadaceae bacterium]|nr:PAS domain S-box protein [Gemmatimonadaceae bacterium]
MSDEIELPLHGDIDLESGDLHRLLVDRVLDYAIFALDKNGLILSWNAGAERLKQYKAAEIIGKHFSIFYPPEALAVDRPGEELRIAKATGRVEDEGWRLRKDGTRFWANVLITALRDDNGKLLGFAKVTRDLSARKAAEESLRQSEERFRLLIQSVQDYAIFMLDADGHVATWNEGAERIKGYAAEDILGKHFSVFYPEEDAVKLAGELEIAKDVGRYEGEGWRRRKDGSRFWASVVITAIHDSKGELAGFAKITRDLTERRAAHERAIADARRLATEEAARTAAEQRARELRELSEELTAQTEELEEQREQAESANRVKSEFLAAMSHELRTPLNAIGGYAQLMQLGLSGPVTDEQIKQLDRVQKSQQHLLAVINDILNFSRMEAGRITYELRPLSVRDALIAVAPIIEPMAGSLGISLDVGNCGPEVAALADRAKVEQVLINLLSNAVKFTEAGGTISLLCGASDTSVWVRVSDTGVGIPPEHLETIFAPFEQVGRSLASPKEGTGLGLTISRDLARGMGGDLSADSEVGKGSTFTLTLPRAPRVSPER